MKTFLLAWSLSLGVPVFEAKSVSLFSKRLCPATSGRFCRKRAPISPWVLGFWTVFGGCCPLSVSLTWGTAGAVRRFGSVRLANPPRSRKRGLRAARAGQQTLRSAPDSRGARGETGAKGHALRGGSREREQGTEVCSFPNAPPSPVHVRLQSCIAPACASGAWRLSCGGGRPSSCRLLPLGGGKAPRDRRVARVRVKRRWTLPHAVCVRLVIGEKCRL